MICRHKIATSFLVRLELHATQSLQKLEASYIEQLSLNKVLVFQLSDIKNHQQKRDEKLSMQDYLGGHLEYYKLHFYRTLQDDHCAEELMERNNLVTARDTVCEQRT